MSGGEARLLGRWGEAQAAEWLRRRGYAVLAAGYRSRFGEIDLIAEGKGMLIFAEVKTRAEGSSILPREAVTSQKQRRIISAAKGFLEKFGDDGCNVRFDVVEVFYSGEKVSRVERIENAFTA